MGQEAVLDLSMRRKELGEEGLAVFFMLLGNLNFENHLVFNQAEIGRKLGMQRQNVQRSIKRLIEMGAILEGPREGRSRSYRLSPNIGWKGSAKNHMKAREDHDKKRMKVAKITGVLPGGKSEEEK